MLVRRLMISPLRRHTQASFTWRTQQRDLASSFAGVGALDINGVHVLGGVISELDRIAPRFEIQAEQVQILESPREFYDVLKGKIRSAKRRIYLSTLYIGKTEHELILTLRDALERNNDLNVSVLTDALRGTRETPAASCASLLTPLVADFPERVEVRMFHTPNLTGLRWKIIPKRINEGWGLQHMKLYGVDDEVILSGANLSKDYFTNRQDRYHAFSSKRVADYYARVHHTICSCSFLLNPEKASKDPRFTLVWPTSNPTSNPLDHPIPYIKATTTLLRPLMGPSNNPSSLSSPISPTSTLLYPLASFTPLLTPPIPSTELPAFTKLLQHLSSPSHPPISYFFTAGYFNPHPIITTLLLAAASTPKSTNSKLKTNTVVIASPQANGFFGSRGVSGMLPAAYSLLSRRFLEAAGKIGAGNALQLREWRRGIAGEADGWTYHAKGLWVTLSQLNNSPAPAVGPSITLVGSSNYTERSYTLDLEMNALIVTGNEGLMKRLAAEEEWLSRYSEKVELDDFRKVEKRVGWHVRVAMWIVRVLGGAL